MSSKGALIAVLSILCLISITLYLAFAFPYSLFQLKQAENNELKSVVIVAQSGDYLPLLDPYSRGDFSSPSAAYKPDLLGKQQLTNMGKERMFLLGKFLKLRYYGNLLQGNPQRVSARSVNTDQALESAQAFLAGLNPAQDNWCWSAAACSELAGWQPKAIHSWPAQYDDLLAPQENCPVLFQNSRLEWKQSTNYRQLVDNYTSTLATLETNTGLELAKNLELVPLVESWLNTRKVVADDQDDTLSKWYTNELVKQLANLTDSVMTGFLGSGGQAQRLYTGRLLNEVIQKIDERIEVEEQRHLRPSDSSRGESAPDEEPRQDSSMAVNGNSQSLRDLLEPASVYLYMTDGQQLTALMNSLQIDSSQQVGPGDLLLIELHRSSTTQSFYLRLFSISSTAPDVFPEPIQVKTIACGDSADCLPDQLRQNIRPLMLDRASWSEACASGRPFEPARPSIPTTTPSMPLSSVPSSTTTTTTTTTEASTPTNIPIEDSSPTGSTEATSSRPPEDSLDANLIVGPLHPAPLSIFQHTNLSNSISTTITTNVIETTPESVKPAAEAIEQDGAPRDQVSINSTQSSTTAFNSTPEAPSTTTTITPLAETLPPGSQVSVLVATLDDRNNQHAPSDGESS